MYLEHFGLNEFPFGITPDTEFFFSSQASHLALHKLLTAMANGEGFVKVTGEVGTGKTMLCRKLIASLDERYRVAYIPNPYLSPNELLVEIATQLGAHFSLFAAHQNLHKEIQTGLLDIHRNGQQAVICLDEAQAMPIESMEALRLLTNFETEKSKLLQVVIFGQPELDVKLNAASIRQLKQRITYSLHLLPLQKQELDEYLTHRLKVAGYPHKTLFTPGAFWLLKLKTGRVPRLVNILAHQAMLEAFERHSTKVGWWHVWKASRESESFKRFPLGLKLLGLGLALSVAGATVWWSDFRDTPPSATAPNATAHTVPAVEAPAESAAEAPAQTPTAVATAPTAPTAPAAQAPASASAKVAATPESLTPAQRAKNAYQEALPLIRNGKTKEAQALLQQTLVLQATHHEARLALARLLVDSQQPTHARTVLRDGIQLAPEKPDFWISLAHMQLQANETDAALETLRKGLRHHSLHAPYQALLAAVLQSKGQHAEANERYQTALQSTPDNPHWWVGLGVSLQALNKPADARNAYRRALEIGLSPALTNEVQTRLTQLTQP